MLGLALDEIDGVLNAATSRSGRRSPQCASTRSTNRSNACTRREVLAGALLCRYDHPATDCRIMGAEIDRRLEATEVVRTPLVTRPGSEDRRRGFEFGT